MLPNNCSGSNLKFNSLFLIDIIYFKIEFKMFKARFRRRISVASNANQRIDNEGNHFVIFCLNCIRREGNSTSKPGLILCTKYKRILPSSSNKLKINFMMCLFFDKSHTCSTFPLLHGNFCCFYSTRDTY